MSRQKYSIKKTQAEKNASVINMKLQKKCNRSVDVETYQEMKFFLSTLRYEELLQLRALVNKRIRELRKIRNRDKIVEAKKCIECERKTKRRCVRCNAAVCKFHALYFEEDGKSVYYCERDFRERGFEILEEKNPHLKDYPREKYSFYVDLAVVLTYRELQEKYSKKKEGKGGSGP